MTSGLLVLAGLLLAVLGLVGLVRGRLGRGLRNRTTSALAVAVGLVVALAAGAVSPAVSDTLAAPAGASSHGAPATRPVRGAPATTPVRGSGATTRPATPSPTPTPRPPTTPAGTTTSPTVAPAPPGPSARAGTALAALATLPVKGRAPRTGYDRDLFGQAWADVDRNGCDTRNDILRRDLTALRAQGRHPRLPRPQRARWTTPTPGSRSRSSAGQATSARRADRPRRRALRRLAEGRPAVEHVDPRTAFANDPLNLLAVDGPTNQAKGDGDAATWLPPRKAVPLRLRRPPDRGEGAGTGCGSPPAERDAVRRVLASCAAQRLPVVAATVPLGGGRSASAAPRPVSTETGTPPPRRPRHGRRPRHWTRASRRAPQPVRPATAPTGRGWTPSTTGTATGTTTAWSASADDERLGSPL